MKYISLYGYFIRIYAKRILQYRSDFLLGFTANFFRSGIGLALVWIIFTNLKSLHGWTYSEVMAIYGISILVTAITSVFTPSLYRLGSEYIIRGQLDRVLLRPINALFQVVADSIGDEALGGITAGFFALFIAITNFQQKLAWYDYGWLIILIILGVIMYLNIVLLSVVVSFWWELPWGILDITLPIAGLAQYPLDIYSTGIRLLLTWVIPFGFTAFLPAAVLLRPMEYQEYKWIIPLVTLLFSGIAYLMWLIGLKRYASSGS